MSKKAKVKNEGELSAWTLKIGTIHDVMLRLGGKPTKSDVDNVIKFHFDELDEDHILSFADLMGKVVIELKIKRSGTGLTVLVFL